MKFYFNNEMDGFSWARLRAAPQPSSFSFGFESGFTQHTPKCMRGIL